MRIAVGLLFCLALGLLCGCGTSASPSPRGVVKGKVTAGGKPVTKGSVTYTPVDPAKGDDQARELNASGEYIVSVFPGKYKVSISGNTAVPTAYQSSKTTTLEIDIPEGGKSDADFDLK